MISLLQPQPTPNPSLPTATLGEHRRHRAHLSPGQIIWRVLALTVLAWMAAVLTLGLDQVRGAMGSLPPWPDPVWRRILEEAWPMLLSACLGAITLLATIVRLSIRTARAAWWQVRQATRRVRWQVNLGLTDASKSPMHRRIAVKQIVSDIPVMSFFALSALLIVSYATQFSVTSNSGALILPLMSVALLIAVGLVWKLLITPMLDPRRLTRAWASLARQPLPARHIRLEIPKCRICDNKASPRPSPVQHVRKLLRSRGDHILQRLEKKSTWVAAMRKHRSASWLIMAGVIWITVLEFSRIDLSTATLITSLWIGLIIIYKTYRQDSPTLLDAMIKTPTRQSWAITFIGFLSGVVFIANGVLVPNLVGRIDAFISGLDGRLDTSLAVLFILGLEACLCYIVFSFIAEHMGISVRWSPSQAAKGAILPLLSFASGALIANWYLVTILAIVAFFVLYTAPYRKQSQSTSRRTAA